MGIVLMVVMVGCTYMPLEPTYSPAITPIATTPLNPIVPTPSDTMVQFTTPTPTISEPVVVSLQAVDHSNWDKQVVAGNAGIGKALHQITFNTIWLKTRDLVAIDISPIYNIKDDNAVFSLTYGIYEQKNIPVAPDYFKNFIKTYSLVDIPGKSWVDVPSVITIPQGTENLPSGTVYFNVAIHDTGDNGSVQMQAAERWEITFK
jgi:hypothetical protein